MFCFSTYFVTSKEKNIKAGGGNLLERLRDCEVRNLFHLEVWVEDKDLKRSKRGTFCFKKGPCVLVEPAVLSTNSLFGPDVVGRWSAKASGQMTAGPPVGENPGDGGKRREELWIERWMLWFSFVQRWFDVSTHATCTAPLCLHFAKSLTKRAPHHCQNRCSLWLGQIRSPACFQTSKIFTWPTCRSKTTQTPDWFQCAV